MTPPVSRKLDVIVEHGFVFVGDLLPYGVVFLTTLMVGYSLGLEAAGSFSLAYAYVAIITALVCSPSLLSLRRQMPIAASPGAVVVAALTLRVTAIGLCALVLVALLLWNGAQDTIPLVLLLLLARFVETSIDGPATSIQYLKSSRDYFIIRLAVFVVVIGVTSFGILGTAAGDLNRIGWYYLLGAGLGLALATLAARRLLTPVSGISGEMAVQTRDFGRFFLATMLFLAATRLHPVIIGYFSGPGAAGQFAMVQNLFSSISLAATGVAGVFFWSRNRKGVQQRGAAIPRIWMLGALVGGTVLGGAGGLVMDFLFLRPLGSPIELRWAAWLLCLSTPMLMTQSILSNQLLLQRRDQAMLLLSAFNGGTGLLLMAILTYSYGVIGAALSAALSALLSTFFGAIVVRRTQ